MQTLTGTDVSAAVTFLQQNKVVAIPTETVYGLAGNALSEEAVREIFRLKQRPLSNPLIVHVDAVDKIRPFVKTIPPVAEKLLDAFAPGPLTVLLPTNGTLSPVVNNGLDKLAFRIPAHPLTRQLLARLSFPLVAPSANRFTTISPTTPAHVQKNFEGQIPYILDGGPCRVGIESTVVGFDEEESVVLYRQGAVTAEAIETLTGLPLHRARPKEQASPGMLPLHYAPATPMLLTETPGHLPEGLNKMQTGLLCFTKLHPGVPEAHQRVLSASGNLAEAAQNLYGCLHFLDELGLECIVAEKLPNVGLGLAINDRLQKAAHR